MSFLHHFMYPLGALYIAIAAVIPWLWSRPTCRICVHRSYCPNRVGRFVVPGCVRKQKSSGKLASRWGM
jgi:hypothetical protein